MNKSTDVKYMRLGGGNGNNGNGPHELSKFGKTKESV